MSTVSIIMGSASDFETLKAAAETLAELADVNVLPLRDGSHEVVVCFMPDPVLLFGEGNSRAFLALDASASLRKMYGFGGPFGGDPNYMQAVARKLGATLTSITRSGKVAALYWAVSPDGSKLMAAMMVYTPTPLLSRPLPERNW